MHNRLNNCFAIVACLVGIGCQRNEARSAPPLVEASVQLGDMRQHFYRGGQGAPVLLLHDLASSWRVWRPYLSALGKDRELLVPDLRGHGQTLNPSQTLSARQVAEDMFGLLDALGIQKVQVIGYSFGSHAALRMAALQPDRIEAMVLVAGGAHQLRGATRQAHEKALGLELPSDWWLQAVGAWYPGGEAQVREVFRQGIAGILADDFEMTDEALASIRTRTLIVQGDRDEWWPLEVTLDMFRKIPGAQLWIIPNTGHNAVFWHDVAPPGVDSGGGASAATQFADVALAFLRQGVQTIAARRPQ